MLDSFKIRRAWDVIHQTQPASKGPEKEVLAFIERIKPRLSPGAALLDAGCGRGRNAIYLSRSGFTVYACDLSSVALGITKARAGEAGLTVNLQESDLTQLSYANDLFAAAICVHVLPYHLKADLVKGIRELRRVLQPNGWLYLDLLAPEDAEYGCGLELEKDTFLDTDGTPLHFSSRQEVDEILHGFVLERITRFKSASSPTHIRVGWTIWAAKRVIA
jgi:SAM-dependent methyltransferase